MTDDTNSTYYTTTSRFAIDPEPLSQDARADLCIVGGGLTGLSAALHAARRGLTVVLLERGTLGDGASGRNGGQVHIGMRRSQRWLEDRLGIGEARALWSIAQDARASLFAVIADEGIDCSWRPGLLHLDHKPGYVAESR
ncbi:MAG: FAD-binding oxidoreductase, partial [Pseudomonadota bacterium]|nr:FAD-binding oxidoreductase [Pseudomonadota bacterium]